MVGSTIFLTAVADDRMVAPLGITLTSILERSRASYDITVVLDNVGQADIDKLKKLGETFGQTIRLVEPEFKQLYSNAKSNQWVTKAAYYRIHMADFLPKEAKKAIYLDCDILCLGDLEELWNESLDGHAVAAVYDPTVTEVTDLGLEYELIGTDLKDGYFNSGVLVVDVEQWRAENVAANISKHVQDFPKFGRFHDQSRLNAYFTRRWKRLPLRYNLQARMMGIQLPGLEPTNEGVLRDSISNPMLVHFNGPCKPWQGRLLNPFKRDYIEVWRRSLWSDWHPKQKALEELRWHFGDLRKHWRQLRWCTAARRSQPAHYAVVDARGINAAKRTSMLRK